jgi:hypothetical protein
VANPKGWSTSEGQDYGNNLFYIANHALSSYMCSASNRIKTNGHYELHERFARPSEQFQDVKSRASVKGILYAATLQPASSVDISTVCASPEGSESDNNSAMP